VGSKSMVPSSYLAAGRFKDGGVIGGGAGSLARGGGLGSGDGRMKGTEVSR
jgi:hypothetical protein